MPIIDVPGQGQVEFPDSMSDDEIVAAIKRNATPDVAASDRVQAVGSGANAGIAGLLGLPVDTGLNVVDLINAGLGVGASVFNKGLVPEIFMKTIDRSRVAGSGEWLRNLANKTPVTTTQMVRPNDAVSQYLHVGGSALPGAMLMQPSTAGQAMTATAANVVPALAGKATADITKGTDYETTAPILANLLAQGGVNRAMQSSQKKPLDAVRRQTLIDSQEAGYKVPPSTTNPTVANKILESIGGKVATQQDAAIKNTEVTNMLARKALGLPDDAPITRESLAQIRSSVTPAYDAVKNVGTITADAQYKQAIGDISARYDKAAKAFPGLANEEIGNLVKSMDQPVFDADSAIDATKILRERSSELYAKGDKTLGKAYKQVSNELEAVIERNLPQKSSVLADFRDARKTIAKTYTVEKALNDATGNVSAIDLARQLKKGSPLTGELKTAAKFGQAFPKAAQPINDSGSVRNTDVIVGAGTSALSQEPGWLLYPFARMGVRKGMLSDAGQKMAIPSLPKNQAQTLTPEQLRIMLMLNQSAQMQGRTGSAQR